MLDGIKNFINEANKIIRKETRKIKSLHREINEYETLIYVIGKTEASGQVLYYKEKINQCYAKIDICLENINTAEKSYHRYNLTISHIKFLIRAKVQKKLSQKSARPMKNGN